MSKTYKYGWFHKSTGGSGERVIEITPATHVDWQHRFTKPVSDAELFLYMLESWNNMPEIWLYYPIPS